MEAAATIPPDPVPIGQPGSVAATTTEPGTQFPAWLLNTGFMTALVLATSCLLAGGYYLYRLQAVTQGSVLRVLSGQQRPEPWAF